MALCVRIAGKMAVDFLLDSKISQGVCETQVVNRPKKNISPRPKVVIFSGLGSFQDLSLNSLFIDFSFENYQI